MPRLRRTKIVCTLGPATDDPDVLRGLLQAGADMLRVNFSHGAAEDQASRIVKARQIAAELGRDVAVLGDLGGPKIRIERFVEGVAVLEEGQRFVLDTELDAGAGTDGAVGVAYKNLPHDVSRGDTLLLGDGHMALEIEAVEGPRVICRVSVGGELTDYKGINRQGGGLTADALTAKDRLDIQTAADNQLDYLAVSFPRHADDIEEARRLLREAGGVGRIVAKIERAEAVRNIEPIVEASDVVMVARGDLGVEVGYAELTGLQKRIIRLTRQMNRIVITATQMMESMLHNPTPTRAEVSDVANAVMDGSDAVMLSAETAVGKYPVKAVKAMAEICLGAEKHQVRGARKQRLDSYFKRTDEAIAMAVMYTANHLDVKAIIALTESGATALWMSRVRSDIPIFALTRHEATRRRVCLYRGVYPLPFDVVHTPPEFVFPRVSEEMLKRSLVDKGDLVIFTKGELSGVVGGTNSMKIMRIRG